MKKCNITEENIRRYLFNQLTEDEETAFQKHLAGCDECSAKVSRVRKLARAFSPDAIAKEEELQVRTVLLRQRFLRPLLVAASVIALIGIGWLSAWVTFKNSGQRPVVVSKVEDPPVYANDGTSGHGESNFTLITPATGKYLFILDGEDHKKNEIVFKWTPKTATALLVIKSKHEILDEIRVNDTDRIKVDLNKYRDGLSVTWFLITSGSDDAKTGIIQLKKNIK